MLTSIIDTSNKRPRAFIKVSLGAGPRSTGSGPIRIALIGNRLAATSAANDETPIPVSTEDDAITNSGSGSEVHRMYRALTKAFRNASVDIVNILPVGTAATYAIAITGTATSSGTYRVQVGSDDPVDISIPTGSTATAAGNLVAAALNAISHAAYTAANVTGTVTLTAKCAGLRGNLLRIRMSVPTAVAGLTLPTSTGAYFTSGATDDNNSLALAGMSSVRYHLVVCPWVDTANIDRVESHMNAQAEATIGRRGRFICANVDTLGNATTFAQGRNSERGQCVWHYLAPACPSEVAAAVAGEVAEGLSTDRATNFDGKLVAGISSQWLRADQPEGTEIVAALNVGLTPLDCNGNDASISRSITMRSLDALSNPDYRVLDTHYVDVADFIADTLQDGWPDRFPNFKLGVDIEGEVPPPGVATANTTRDWCVEVLGKFDNNLIENFDTETVPNMVFERSTAAKGRVDAVIPIDVIELFHQFAADVRQVG